MRKRGPFLMMVENVLLGLCNSPGKTISIKLVGQVEDGWMGPQPPALKPVARPSQRMPWQNH